MNFGSRRGRAPHWAAPLLLLPVPAARPQEYTLGLEDMLQVSV